jgi:copper chaperone CopZ
MSKQSAYFRIPDLSGDHGSKDIKQSIDSIRGVISVSVNASTNKVAVDYDSTGTSCDSIKNVIEKAGYTAQLIANQDNTM